MIYKILSQDEWNLAKDQGLFAGSAIDIQDGYIHFSSSSQVKETAAKHFAGQQNLVLIGIDDANFGSELKWEPSRNDDLFPHLYGSLDTSLVATVDLLSLDSDGRHVFPNLTN